MSKSNLKNYLGAGLASERPSAAALSADIYAKQTAVYLATDTGGYSLLNPAGTPSWIEFMPPSLAVTSVFGRTNDVVAVAGDYNAEKISFSPFGGISGANVQIALQELDVDKFNVPTGNTSQYLRGDGTPAAFPSIPGGTVTSVNLVAPVSFDVSGGPVTGSGTLTLAFATGFRAYTDAENTKLAGVASGATANTGTATSVGLAVPTGFSVANSPITTSGVIALSYASGYQGYTSAEATKLAGVASGATANTGTVTSVSAAGANGLTLTVSNPTTSPTIALGGVLGIAGGGHGATTQAGAQANLGIGTAGLLNTGTTGATIPRNDTANVFSQPQTIDSDFYTGRALVTGRGVTTQDVVFEHGGFRTADGSSLFDFHAVPGTDFDARIGRIGGANGEYQLVQTGTAPVSIYNGSMSFQVTPLAANANGPFQVFSIPVIDAARIVLHRSYTVTTLPAGTSTGIISASNLGGGEGLLEGFATGWRKIGDGGYTAITSDAAAAFAFSYLAGGRTTHLTSAITAARTVILTAAAPVGARARFTRAVSATGAFNWSIGALKNLTPGTWCEIESDGANWQLIQYGSL